MAWYRGQQPSKIFSSVGRRAGKESARQKKVFDIMDVIRINNRCTYNLGLSMVLVKFLL